MNKYLLALLLTPISAMAGVKPFEPSAVSRAGDTMTGKLTISAGGLKVSSASVVIDGTNADLAVAGTTFTVANSGIISAGSQPGVDAYLSGAQAIPSAVLVPIYFDTEQFDAGNWHSNTVSSDTFTTPAGGGGTYSIGCQIAFAGNATGYRECDIKINSTIYIQSDVPGTVATQHNVICGPRNIVLAAGDTVKCFGYQSSGGSLNAAQTLPNTYITIKKLW